MFQLQFFYLIASIILYEICKTDSISDYPTKIFKFLFLIIALKLYSLI